MSEYMIGLLTIPAAVTALVLGVLALSLLLRLGLLGSLPFLRRDVDEHARTVLAAHIASGTRVRMWGVKTPWKEFVVVIGAGDVEPDMAERIKATLSAPRHPAPTVNPHPRPRATEDADS